MSIKAENITKYFHEPQKQKVLDQISLEIYPSELTSVFGESGSGKSTLLYILASLDIEFEGQLNIMGQPVRDLSDDGLSALRNRHIGFVYQSHYLLPEFNVLQNIMLPALRVERTNPEAAKERAHELLQEIGLEAYANRPSYKLSGGQQQRIAIARALINDPAIIIADEPTGNLDNKNSQMVFELLKSIAEKRQKSVLIATHSTTLMKNSHRTFEMIDGSLRL